MFNPKSVFVQSGPQPQITLSVPGEILIGEDFVFTVTFRNAGSPGEIGYGPFIDLVLDAGGANTKKAPPCAPCDGITFVKGEMVGVVGGPITLNPTSPSPITTTPCGLVSNSNVPHPLASSGILPVTVPPGGQLVTLELPFGSFDPTQPEITVEVTAHVSNFADAGTPLTISARGGFRYGADPLDNPNADPPILSEVDTSGNQITDSTQWAVQAQTTPTVITISKSYLGPEDENATGPNFIGFYPLRYEITVDIANGQTVDNVTVMDCLPNNMAYHGLVSATPLGFTLTEPPIDVPSNPSNNCLILEWPSLTGGLGPDAIIIFEFFIPETDANGMPVLPPDCEPVLSINDIIAEADWTPLDPCDPSPTHVVSDVKPNDHILSDKCIAIQKSVAIFQDTGAPGPTPGDTLEYTLNFQVSDFKTFGNLEIEDVLSDGQQFLLSPPPTLTVTDQFGSVSGNFILNADLLTQADPAAQCQGITGGTRIAFHISQKMINLNPPNPRHAAGILTGGWTTTPTSTTPATGQIVFQARIKDQFDYNHLVGNPLWKFVVKDDPLANCVELRGEVFTNVDPPTIPSPTGVIATDDSETLTSIVTDIIKKTVYAVVRNNVEICGPNTIPCPSKPQVAPGDQVTFRIEKTIPSGDADNLAIEDWLPLPIFDVADPNANGVPGPAWAFLFSPCGIPSPGQSCLGPNTPIVPTAPVFSANATTNSLQFDYASFANSFNTLQEIDLLFTITATNEPFADGLFLTNETQECETNTFGTTFCQVAIAQVQVMEPELRITKGVVAADNPSAVFSPAPPPPGTFDPPGSMSCPRFSGTISSDNLSSLNLNSNVSNVDANDCVTFAIVVENSGSWPAYDIKLRDIFPLDPTDIPTCFIPDIESLCVTDGTGASLPFTLTPSAFGSFVIELQNPLPGLDPNNPGSGTNIVVITFDACIIPNIQPHCCDNRTRLENYSNTPDGPNFVDAGFGGPFEDTAEVCVQPRPYAKCIQTTSELHTTPQSASQGSTVDAAIGEIVRFRLITVIPEGITLGFQIQDLLPVGLTYMPGTARIVFVADTSVTSGVAFWPTVAGNENTVQCPGSPIPTELLLEGGGPFTPGAGVDPFFFVGVQALPITNNDNDPDLEFAIIEFNALVDNIANNQNSTVLPNQFQVHFEDEAGNKFTKNSGMVNVHIVEPSITIQKQVTIPPESVGATVTYTVTLTNSGSATAFDVQLTDALPPCLTNLSNVNITPGGGATGITNNSTGTTLDVAMQEIPVGGSVTVEYTAALGECECDETINTATVTWTSLPGPKGTVSNPTGSTTPGTSGDPDGERNGSGGVNDYVASATANLCPDLMITKTAMGDFMAGLNGLYVIEVKNVGNGPTTGPIVVTDTLPPGLTFVSSAGTNWSCAASGQTITCTYTGPPVPPNGTLPPITITVSIDPSAGPSVTNCAQVTNGTEINLANNESCVTVDVKPEKCLLIKNEKITCNPDGTFTYTFDLTNISDFPASKVILSMVTPPGVTLNPDMIDLSPPLSGQPNPGTTTITVTISGPGAITGATICFLVSIHQEINGVFVNCCTPNVAIKKCIVLPPCPECDPAPGECCARKPTFAEAVNFVDYTSFTGQVAVATCFADPLNPPVPGDPGYVLGVVDLKDQNLAPLNQNWQPAMYHHPDWIRDNLGNIFGLTLDARGNIYVTATSAYSADFFGSGGPGAVYRIDGQTGLISTFATLPNDPVARPALGNISYDCVHDQFFVTNLEDGKIYRLDASGNILPTFDPGAPDDGSAGFAPLGERLWGIEVHNGRVYYSVWKEDCGKPDPAVQNEIRSVGLDSTTGDFIPSTDRLELLIPSVPGADFSNPVSDISFSPDGKMLLAERTMLGPTQPNAHVSRALEYICEDGDWIPSPNLFKVGVPNVSSACPKPAGLGAANSAGGVDYDYDSNSTFGVWVTGDALQFGPDLIYGLQGFPSTGGTVNDSALIDLNGNTTESDKTEIGDVEIPCPEECIEPPDGLVGWWPLDETSGTTAVDLSSQDNHGAYFPSSPLIHVPGKVAGAFRGGVLGGVVQVPDDPSLNFGASDPGVPGSGDLTIDAWIKIVPHADEQAIVFKTSSFVGPFTGYVFFLIDNRLAFNMGDGSTSLPGFGFGAEAMDPILDQDWHHVAVTVDRDNPQGGKLFIDGVPVMLRPGTGTGFTFDPTLVPGSLANNLMLFIGNPGAGEIDVDEVEIFNRALSEAEIKAIYDAGSAGKCKGAICGMKFNDLDGDGEKDEGEPGVGGWTIILTDSQGNTLTATTDEQGNYCFTNLTPGTYTVSEEIQAGWTPTTPPGGTTVVQVSENQVVTVNFGNQNPCVPDQEPPVITCPQPVSFIADAQCSARPLDATATDNCDPAPTITKNPSTLVGLGFHTVTYTATDASGNSSTCTVTFEVVDLTPPTIMCPTDVTVECTGPEGAAVEFAATATDNCDATPTISCTPPSGSTFPIGTTTVTCTATDDSGNTSSCSFTVTVVDTTPPPITCGVVQTLSNQVGDDDNFHPGDPGDDPGPGPGFVGCSFGGGPQGLDQQQVSTCTVWQHQYQLPPGACVVGARLRLKWKLLSAVCDPCPGGIQRPTESISFANAALGQVNFGRCHDPFTLVMYGNCSPQTSGTSVLDLSQFPGVLERLDGTPLTVAITDDTAIDFAVLEIDYVIPSQTITLPTDPDKCCATTTVAACATDTCGPVTITNDFDPIQGGQVTACFPLGTTTVTFTATDASGNTSTCTVTVEVVSPSLELNTGFDQATGQVIPVGGTDDDWRVVADPTNLNVPRPADVVAPFAGWPAPLPNSQWVSVSPNRGFPLPAPPTDFEYEFRFCLAEGFQNAMLSLQLWADDEIRRVELNGTTIGGPGGNFGGPPLQVTVGPTSGLPFQVGTNVLKVVVTDKAQVVTGLNVAGMVTACGLIECGSIHGMKFNDLNGNGQMDPGEPSLQGWTIQLTDASGNPVASTSTDADGNYWFVNLAPGAYTVSEVVQPGWTQTFPPLPGTHTVNLGPGQVVENRDFGNASVCCDVSPDTIDFGQVCVGQSVEQTFIITNCGSVPIVVTGINSNNPVFQIVSPPLPIVIPPGGSVTVAVVFTCTEPGTQNGTISIVAESASGPVECGTVTVTGFCAQACCAVTPNVIDFGQVCVGQSVERTFTVTNCGNVPLTISAITSSNSAFTIVSPTLLVTVPPGGSVTVTVRFTCTTPGPQSGIISITASSICGPVNCGTVTVTGFCAQACCTVSPSAINFGNVCVGQSATQTFTITNCGNVPLTISAINSSNPAFTIVSPALPVTVPAGGNVTVTVRLTCTIAGPQSGTISLITSSICGPVNCGTVSVSGTCLLIAGNVNPTTLDFGNVTVGQNADRTFTVTNTGNGAFTINAINSSNPAFTVVSPALPVTVLPGGSVTVTVRLTCAGPGSQSGTLSFGTSSACGPVNLGSVNLTGVCVGMACINPPPNMVAWWPMDETSGTTVADIVGGNNGTHFLATSPSPTPSNVVPAPGKVPAAPTSGALKFGLGFANNYVQVPNSASLNFGTGDFSVDAWIMPEANQLMPILFKGSSSGPGYLLLLAPSLVTSGLHVRVALAGVSGPSVNHSSTQTIPIGSWTHVAVTVQRGSATGGKVYINGSLDSTFNTTGLGNLDNTAPFLIGRAIGTPNDIFYNGRIDEVEIFRRALSPSEVQAIFNAGSAGKCKPTGPTDLPDLVVENLQVPLPPIFTPFGALLTVNFTIANRGQGQAVAANHRIFFVRPDGTAVELQPPSPVPTSLLRPGDSTPFTLPITLPASLCSPLGGCRGSIHIVADADNQVRESNEGNNTAQVPIPTGP